jgi:hypothetical protein
MSIANNLLIVTATDVNSDLKRLNISVTGRQPINHEETISGSTITKRIPLNLPAGNYSVTVTAFDTSTQTSTSENFVVNKIPTQIKFSTSSGFISNGDLVLNGKVIDSHGITVSIPNYAIRSGDAVIVDGKVRANSSCIVEIEASFNGNQDYLGADTVIASIFLWQEGDPIPNIRVKYGNTVINHNAGASKIVGTEKSPVLVNTTTTTTLLVENTGASTLRILDAYFENDLLQNSILSDSIIPGQVKPITVTYTPQTVSGGADKLVLITNDPNHPQYIINLKVPSYFVIPYNAAPLTALFDTTSFGKVQLGQSVSKNIRILNTGLGDMTIESVELPQGVTITGTYSDINGTLAPCALTAPIYPQAAIKLTLTYTASALGEWEGEIKVKSKTETFIINTKGIAIP